MTEAGWTRKKPTVAGWYWWRGKEESGIALVFPADKPMPWHTSDHSARVQLFYSAGGMSSTRVNHFGGEWLGPISPTDRQQGFQDGCVEGLRRAGIAYAQWINNEYRPSAYARFEDWCEMEAQLIAQAAQAAQDEKGVGDAQ